jgi:hypothetical protein
MFFPFLLLVRGIGADLTVRHTHLRQIDFL